MRKDRIKANSLLVFLIFSLLLSSSGLLLTGTLAQAQSVYDRHVVVLAIDALKADVFRRYAFKGEGNPPPKSFFRELSMPNGEYKNHLDVRLTKAVFPTYTFAAWPSVFTGTYPGKHGIVGNSFYIRDWDKQRAYDAGADLWDILGCDIPDAIKVYGWDFDCVKLWAAIGSFALLPDVFNWISFGQLLAKLPKPYVWGTMPTPFGPVPMKFTLFEFYESGGIQNGDLLKRTLYDYAKDQDFITYVIHNFYNRSNLDQSGKRVPWEDVYGSDLKGMDEFWGRPSYSENRDAVLKDPHDYEILDKVVVPKAINYVKNANGLPHILTLYFACVDGESHHFDKFGYPSLDQAQLANLRKIDLWLMDFVKFLKTDPKYGYDKTIFLLIADHGQIPRQIPPKNGLSHNFPADEYMVKTNGYMAHVYIKNSQTGNWKDLPTQQDVNKLMNDIFQYISVKDFENVILVRAPGVGEYKAYYWDNKAWNVLPLEKLEELPFAYIDAETRINGVNNLNRSGDVILQPKKHFGFTDSPSTHGSMYDEDTFVPFYIFGEPVTKTEIFSRVRGPMILCGASHVDVTPTILNIFDIYKLYRGNLDGKPLLDKDLRINTDDFSPCRGSGASDFLYGRWKNFEGESTQIILHNPSSVSRDAVLVYYGWREDFKACQIVRLSPHDLVVLDPPLEGGGPVEIRAGPLEKEKRPGGLVGYVVRRSGGTTQGIVQLILDDPELFNIDVKNQKLIYDCACDKLIQMKSPLQKYFCPRRK
jgi:hypothetical protein